VGVAYGISSSVVEHEQDVEEHIRRMFENPLEPYLLEVVLAVDSDALPKIAFGKSMEFMDPETPGTRIAPKAFVTQ
jgi:thiamine pyrophosphate-dependent acetolactate synthase large subunit-like protein